MANFLTGDELNSHIVKLIEKAEKQLIIISPFIKLHDRIKDKLKSRIHDNDLEIIIVYGKNEDNRSKSLNENDLAFFKTFPNIEIRYEIRLHAKYYANDDQGILTSMNLYDFSHNNNIEFGVLIKSTLISNLLAPISGDSMDSVSFNYFMDVIENSELCFKKEPFYKTGWMGLTSDYTHSEITFDNFNKAIKHIDFVDTKKTRATGYCIRTGTPIKFNPKRPFTEEAYIAWSRYKKPDYKEKFCHFSGEASDGQTSFALPIMRRNFSTAKKKYGF